MSKKFACLVILPAIVFAISAIILGIIYYNNGKNEKIGNAFIAMIYCSSGY